MNGYDFDKTIYNGDCLVDFYIYTILRRPFMLFVLPVHFVMLMLYYLKLISKKRIKELMMFQLRFYKNKSVLVKKFWKEHIFNIKNWYLSQKREDDIIITASPEFLVRPVCEKLDLKNIIGTKMNEETQKISGKNCYGKEKVVRFREQFPDIKLNAFYSDSMSDLPMMQISEKGILVKGDKRTVIFEEKADEKNEKEV